MYSWLLVEIETFILQLSKVAEGWIQRTCTWMYVDFRPVWRGECHCHLHSLFQIGDHFTWQKCEGISAACGGMDHNSLVLCTQRLGKVNSGEGDSVLRMAFWCDRKNSIVLRMTTGGIVNPSERMPGATSLVSELPTTATPSAGLNWHF
jgi:hypothetical protein